MTLIEYLEKYPLTRSQYTRDQVHQIRIHAFNAGTPEKKMTRSQKQNAYYWGVVLKIMGDHLGYLPEEMHQLMGKEFLSYENLGEVFIRSTTKLNTKEMEDYLEKVRRFASMELGCFIPLPNETEFDYSPPKEKAA